jgi:hypothetical protein
MQSHNKHNRTEYLVISNTIKVKNSEQISSGKNSPRFSHTSSLALTGFDVMDSILDWGTRGNTKGWDSLSTQGLPESGLVIATLLSSSEQRIDIYYP